VSRAIRRCWLLSGVALCAVLAGPVAIAQASDNTLRLTLNSYASKITNDEAAVKDGIKVQYPLGHWKRLTRALKHEVGDLRSLRAKLRPERASTSRGTKAKKEIVRGLGLIANAYAALRTDVLAVHGGAVPLAQVNAAVATDKKGIKKLRAGLKLLA
jgi:hypothetical protein